MVTLSKILILTKISSFWKGVTLSTFCNLSKISSFWKGVTLSKIFNLAQILSFWKRVYPIKNLRFETIHHFRKVSHYQKSWCGVRFHHFRGSPYTKSATRVNFYHCLRIKGCRSDSSGRERRILSYVGEKTGGDVKYWEISVHNKSSFVILLQVPEQIYR